MHRLYLLLLILGSVATLAQEPARGIIRGTVLDDGGSPVANAYVAATLMNGSKTAAVLETYTDRTGQYVFQGLPVGEYRMSAEKQEDGYRSTKTDVFGQPAIVLFLTADEPLATATIHFAAKAGVISGWVKDAKTGAPVAAQLRVAPDKGSGFLGTATSGKEKFRMLLPANIGFTFEVSAPGYKTWSYHEPTKPGEAAVLTLAPGTEMKMEIKLERAENAVSAKE